MRDGALRHRSGTEALHRRAARAICVGLLLVFGSTELWAESAGRTSFVSALPAGDRERLATALEVPESVEDAVVYCDARIRSNGRFGNMACLPPRRRDPAVSDAVVGALSRAVLRMTETLRVAPARINGRPVDAQVQFTVIVSRSQIPATRILPYQVTDVTAIDPDRVAPQRLGQLRWPFKSKYCRWYSGTYGCSTAENFEADGNRLALEVDVGEDGQSLACRLRFGGRTRDVDDGLSRHQVRARVSGRATDADAISRAGLAASASVTPRPLDACWVMPRMP
jgi:hypothetical protein